MHFQPVPLPSLTLLKKLLQGGTPWTPGVVLDVRMQVGQIGFAQSLIPVTHKNLSG
jgi:hypothetical protein